MPADERFIVVHEKAKPKSTVYGCHNRPRPVEGAMIQSKVGAYPYRHSTECRYDRSSIDPRCKDCKHSKSFEDWQKSNN